MAPPRLRGRPWADLNEELLEQIFKTLDSSDIIRCFDVCLSWRYAVGNSFRDQLLLVLPPSLLIRPKTAPPKLFSCTKTREGIAETNGGLSRCFYSYRGWLLLAAADACPDNAYLFNPWSGIKLRLPTPPQGRNNFPSSFITSHSASDPKCVVLACNTRKTQLFCCGLTSEHWTFFPNRRNTMFEDMIYYKGCFYIIGTDGRITTIMLNGHPPMPYLQANPKQCFIDRRPAPLMLDTYYAHRYWVESWCGELLLVRRYVRLKLIRGCKYRTKTFDVSRLETSTGAWDEVTNFGDRALFLAHNDSVFVTAGDVCRKNCIYFVDDFMKKSCGKDSGVYDMEKKKVVHKLCKAPFGRWFRPDM